MLSRFLYFIPQGEAKDPRLLINPGLAGRFAAVGNIRFVQHVAVPLASGPSGGPGVLVALGARPPEEFNPARHSFAESCTGKFWLAVEEPELPPGPLDLVRETFVQGFEVELARGIWIVPLLWRWDRARCEHVSCLPRRLVSAGGRVQARVSPEYRQFDDLAARVWKAYLEGKPLSLDAIFNDAVALLALNYRLGGDEVSLLGLLNESTAMAILGACIDLDEIRQHSADIALGGLAIGSPNTDEEVAHNG